MNDDAPNGAYRKARIRAAFILTLVTALVVLLHEITGQHEPDHLIVGALLTAMLVLLGVAEWRH